MRILSVAAAAALATFAFSQFATAADMPVKAAPAPIVAPVYNWTGFYVGLNAGAVFGHAENTTTTVFSPTGYFATSSVPAIAAVGNPSMDQTGFTGGIQLGYNWQFNSNAVLGIETDFGYMGMNTSAFTGAVYPCCAPTAFAISQSAKTDWVWTLRPRLGWAVNNWMIYLTGGLAVTQVKGDFIFTDTFATAHESASISETRAGWAVGGGLEYAYAGPWTVKLEYLHLDFGTVSATSTNLTAFTPPIAFPTNVFTHSIKVTDDIVRVGLNYRFR